MALGLEYFAESNKEITFLHTLPRLVPIQIYTRLKEPEGSGVVGKVLVALLSRFGSTL